MAEIKNPKKQPKRLIIEMEDGEQIVLGFTQWKPSRASGKPNANAISKMVVDGRMCQVGCNLTILD